ncbi:MAG: arsenite methyltransferase [Promethearchaeota archaeon]|nr:MAG: arsenite methyltransferase [Candidatus Lokiarchaeota archaeon]
MKFLEEALGGPVSEPSPHEQNAGCDCGCDTHSHVPEVLTHNSDEIKDYVRQRYASLVSKSGSSCCGPSASCCSPVDTATFEVELKDKLKFAENLGYTTVELQDLPPEVTDISFGCGNPTAIAALKPGEIVLDLGSGGGIDVFLAAKKVAPHGKAIGLDMTPEMIERASANARLIGIDNVEFKLGEIEAIPIIDDSVDVVISNCVINLSPDKAKVFRQIYRVLRPGGRMVVSDIVLNGDLPDFIKKDFEAWAGCIAGALQESDYLKKIEEAGFEKIEVESRRNAKELAYAIKDSPEITQRLENKFRTDTETLLKRIISIKVKAVKPK